MTGSLTMLAFFSRAASTKETVSYTHLDVYKRQVVMGMMFVCALWMSVPDIEASARLTQVQKGAADVYKRQVLDMARTGAPFDGAFTRGLFFKGVL